MAPGSDGTRDPVEPPASRWQLPDPRRAGPDDDDLLGMGADLEPGTVLAAYRQGLFPMPSGPVGPAGLLRTALGVRRPPPVGWWSPALRGVLELEGLVVSRSLRRSCRDFEIRVDSAFADVLDGCADPRRPHGWIDTSIRTAYLELHRLGWAHSVETWRDGRLEGGLYGLGIGGLFAGESMFHRARDASKVALVGLVELLRDQPPERAGPRLIDVQWSTPHLAGLGVSEIDRADYLDRLPGLLTTAHADFG